jgi:hypothetical protein
MILAVPLQAAFSAPALSGWWRKCAWAKLARSRRARPRGSPQQPGLAATESPSKTSSLKPMASVPGAAERVDPDDNSRALRDFFVWLSWQPGFKSRIRREISTISILR